MPANQAGFDVAHEAADMILLRQDLGVLLVDVRSMPKVGWMIEKFIGKYGRPHDEAGEKRLGGVKVLTWSKGRLAADEYDEFTFIVFLAADLVAGETIYFPVVQQCEEQKVVRWTDIPVIGSTARDYEFPAPELKIQKNKSSDDMHYCHKRFGVCVLEVDLGPR